MNIYTSVLGWAVGYVILRLALWFPDDLGALSGWPSLVLAAAAAGAALWRRWWASLAVAAALAIAAYRLVLDLFGLFMPASGIGFDAGPFFTRLACAGGAVLLGIAALKDRPRLSARWTPIGAAITVAAFTVRVIWQLGFEPTAEGSMTFADDPLMGSLTLVPFVFAGLALPAALMWARRIPRWMLVVPAVTASVLILAYFASGTVTLAARSIDDPAAADILRRTWLADLAYVAWGVGLALAVAGHRNSSPSRSLNTEGDRGRQGE